jgi:hypothetical protein
MLAKRETLAASGAEARKHGAEDASASLEDALAYLAEQGAARPQARQCRGSFSRRRRCRFAARLVGKCRRIGKFHNTHPTSARAKPRAEHSGTRFFVLPTFTVELAWTLPCHLYTSRLCRFQQLSVKW